MRRKLTVNNLDPVFAGIPKTIFTNESSLNLKGRLTFFIHRPFMFIGRCHSTNSIGKDNFHRRLVCLKWGSRSTSSFIKESVYLARKSLEEMTSNDQNQSTETLEQNSDHSNSRNEPDDILGNKSIIKQVNPISSVPMQILLVLDDHSRYPRHSSNS